MRRYTADELRKLPTLAVGQADDLKVENATRRVWLSQCGVADGEPYPDKITVEAFQRATGRWTEVDTYAGGDRRRG